MYYGSIQLLKRRVECARGLTGFLEFAKLESKIKLRKVGEDLLDFMQGA